MDRILSLHFQISIFSRESESTHSGSALFLVEINRLIRVWGPSGVGGRHRHVKSTLVSSVVMLVLRSYLVYSRCVLDILTLYSSLHLIHVLVHDRLRSWHLLPSSPWYIMLVPGRARECMLCILAHLYHCSCYTAAHVLSCQHGWGYMHHFMYTWAHVYFHMVMVDGMVRV